MKTIGLIDEKVVTNNLINLKNIVFEVTEKCNLKCKYCGLSERLYEKHDVREFRDLPFEKAKLMINYLLELWNDNYVEDMNLPFIVSFYGGEPLLNIPLIEKIIDYIEKSNIQ
uniref:4Fe-4S cluster-binding domain-containing protein n=1 Tax=Parabacteroides sp. TaxID=1869337 RepID=UPI003080A974